MLYLAYARPVSAAALCLSCLFAWAAGPLRSSGLADHATTGPFVCLDEAALADLHPEESADAVIGKIRVIGRNVFDPQAPGEDRKVFQWVNRFHRRTRQEVVHRQLLFRSGEPFSPRRLEESARLLRAQRYLREAEVCPTSVEDGRVDVAVITQDVWTLVPTVSFRRSGGANATRLEVQDYNFLGTGRELVLRYQSSVDRDSTLLRYRDPGLAGSRFRLEVAYEDNSDGGRELFHLERPFFALETRWAAGIEAFREEREDSLYGEGVERRRFRHDVDFLEVYLGTSEGLDGGWVRRISGGLTYSRHRFGGSGDRSLTGGDLPFQEPPPGRTLVFPWIGFQLLQDQFVEDRQLEKMGRIEDVHLGLSLEARLGFSVSGLGADREQGILAADLYKGWRPRERALVVTRLAGGGRWGEKGSENVRIGGEVSFFLRNFGRHLFFSRLRLDRTWNLDPESQLLLGGDSGLRGYPLRFQEGDHRWLLTAEQRFFTDLHLFKLVRVGAAAFFDIGTAYFSAGPGNEILKDVGVGLRLSSSRSGSANVLHLDLAFPLDRRDGIDSVQWLITTKETF